MISESPQHRMMIINLDNIPGTTPPIGETDSGDQCRHLAILYHWPWPRSDQSTSVTTPVSPVSASVKTSAFRRKISASLSLERKMLSIVDVYAIFPVFKKTESSVSCESDDIAQ